MATTEDSKTFSITSKVTLLVTLGKCYNSIQFRRLTKNGIICRFYVNLTDVFAIFDKKTEVETLLSLTSLGEKTVKVHINKSKFIEVKCFGDYKRPIAELRAMKGDAVQPWFFFFTVDEWRCLNENRHEITRWLHTEYAKKEVARSIQYKWMCLNSENELKEMSPRWDFVKTRALMDGVDVCQSKPEWTLRLDERQVLTPTMEDVIIFTLGVLKRENYFDGPCYTCLQSADEMVKFLHKGYSVCLDHVDSDQMEDVLKRVCDVLGLKYKPPGGVGDPRAKLTEDDEQLIRDVENGFIGEYAELVELVMYCLESHTNDL